MNYIKHLTGFFDKVIQDRHLNPTHISLYIALFQQWNINRFQNPISITRDEMMRISKIASKATYHKCIRELNDKGFLKYDPSFNPYRGSMVFLFNFSDEHKPVQKKERNEEKNEPIIEQALDKLQTATETTSRTGTEQALVPSINYINNINNSNNLKLENESELAEKIDEENILNFENETQNENSEEKKLREKKKDPGASSSMSSRAQSRDDNPTFEQVHSYFLQNNFAELEAYKFYNYFASIGWLVGGKIPMVDWQAAAQNWIFNTTKFNNHEPPNRPAHLNTTTEKNYDEPL